MAMGQTIAQLAIALGLDARGVAEGAAVSSASLSGLEKSTAASATSSVAATSKAEAGVTNWGAAAQKAAGVVGVALLAGAVIVGVATAKMAGDFQQSMTQVVTGAGESQSAIKGIGDGILAMAGEVGETPAALAKGIYLIESAGFHAKDALTVLRAAAEGAATGNADLAVVANGVTSVLTNYGLSAASATKITSEMVATVAVGKMHFGDLAAVMGTVLPTAAALHVPFEQIAGAMAVMTTKGTDSAKAAQSLRFVMAALAGPTSAAAAELKGLGLSASEATGFTADTIKGIKDLGLNTSAVSAAMTGPGGLPAAMKMITDALAKTFPLYKTNAAQAAAYEAGLKGATGGVRGFTASLELSGAGAVTWAQNVASISKAGKAAGKDVSGFALIQQNMNFQLKQAHAATDALGISIGTGLLPMITAVLKAVTPVIIAMANWATANPKLAASIVLIVGGLGALLLLCAVLGPIISGVAAVAGVLGTVIGAISLPVLLIGAAIVGLIVVLVLLVTHWDQVRTAVVTFATEMVAGVIAHFNDLKNFVGGMIDTLAGYWKQFADNPIYWIGYLIGWLGVTLTNLGHSFDMWLSNIVTIGFLKASEFVMNIEAWFGRLPGDLWNIGVSVTASVGAWINSLPGLALNAAVGLHNAISNEMNSLPGQMVALGADMINGLVQGITRTVSGAINAVKNLVGGILAGARAAAGANSPSRVFAEQVGRPIAEGTEVGIDQGHSRLVAAGRRLVGNVAQGAGQGVAGGATAGVGATIGKDQGGSLARIEKLMAEQLALWKAAASNRAVAPGATTAAARVGA